MRFMLFLLGSRALGVSVSGSVRVYVGYCPHPVIVYIRGPIKVYI